MSILILGVTILSILLGVILLLILFSLLSMAQRADAQLERFEEALKTQAGPAPVRVGGEVRGKASWSKLDRRLKEKELQPGSPEVVIN